MEFQATITSTPMPNIHIIFDYIDIGDTWS